MIILGVDPAGLGRDKAAFSAMLYDGDTAKQIGLDTYAKTKSTVLLGIARERIRHYHPMVTAVDAVGSDLADHLEESGIYVIRIFGGGRATEPDTYHNRRSELYCRLRNLMEKSKIKLIENDALKLSMTQLLPPFLTKVGKWRVESKDDFKARAGYSPDELDCTVYSLITEADLTVAKDGVGGGEVEVHRGNVPQYDEWSGDEDDGDRDEYEASMGHF